MHQGPESLTTITAVDNLATTLQALRKLDEAEELFQRLIYCYIMEKVTISFTCTLVSCLEFFASFFLDDNRIFQFHSPYKWCSSGCTLKCHLSCVFSCCDVGVGSLVYYCRCLQVRQKALSSTHIQVCDL